MTLLQHTSHDPWREFNQLFGIGASCCPWKPSFDISETDSAYVLRGDLPGVSQDGFEVRIDGNNLTLRGKRGLVRAEDDFRHHRMERPGGDFARRFVVPMNVNRDDVKASFDNGVIEIVLPKQAPQDTSQLIPIRRGTRPGRGYSHDETQDQSRLASV